MLAYYKTHIFLMLTSDSSLPIIALVNRVFSSITDILPSAVFCMILIYANESLISISSLRLYLYWLCKCSRFDRQIYILS